MKRQRNMTQLKEQNKTPEKELNKMETSNPLDAELKTLVIRKLNEFSEKFNSIKKIKSEFKDTLIERETTVQWMKPRIKSMIWNIREQKTTDQNNKRKKESKKMRIV